MAAIFRDSAELRAYLGRMFEIFVETPEHAETLRRSGLVVRLVCSDPDCVIVVDFANRDVCYPEPAGEARTPNVEMRMNSRDAHLFWLGKLSFPLAMAHRKVRMDGSTAKAMKLLPLTEPLFDIYRRLLTDAGRTDLIAAG
jgi:hypothetical protein